MDEYEIASTKVIPYLIEQLKWPATLISEYGRVPVQVGTSIAWADLVCYLAWRNKPSPYLLVEVKQEGEDLEQWTPQAESYALMLGAPFFVITDGAEYLFYLTGKSQGDSVRLQSKTSVPLPSEDYLPDKVDFVSFPPQLDPLVDLFFQALKSDTKFLKDTIWHSECLEYWNKKVFAKLDKVNKEDLREGILRHMMPGRKPVTDALLKAIKDDFAKIKKVLRFIADWKGDPVQNLNRLLDRRSDLHIKMFGPFIVTQLLAAAHPSSYGVLQDSIASALKDLQMTHVVIKTGVANGYVYANEICKRIYREKLEGRVKNMNLGLAKGFELVAVHNFLWHYYENYKKGKPWGGG